MRIALLSVVLIGFLLGSCGTEPTVTQTSSQERSTQARSANRIIDTLPVTTSCVPAGRFQHEHCCQPGCLPKT